MTSRLEIRGAGTATRRIHHIIKPDFPARSARMVEVYTPGGNWSTLAAAQARRDDMPSEAVLEEIYYYQAASPRGLGDSAAVPFATAIGGMRYGRYEHWGTGAGHGWLPPVRPLPTATTTRTTLNALAGESAALWRARMIRLWRGRVRLGVDKRPTHGRWRSSPVVVARFARLAALAPLGFSEKVSHQKVHSNVAALAI